MNSEKQSNRPLIISIISILACVVLLIGATMAWFTDTETNTGNRIQAGTLDVELYKYTGTESVDIIIDDDWTQITDTTESDFIFNFDPEEGWQPGDTETIYLAVKNAGSLTFDYNIDLVVEDDALADALQVKITYDEGAIPTTETTYQTISSLVDIAENGEALAETTGNIYLAQNGKLSAEVVDYIKVEIKLDESTGNIYQDLAFEMDLILTATQEDADDTIVKAYDIGDITSLTETDTDKTVILMDDITDANEEVTIPTNVNIDLNGYILTVKSFSMKTDDICTVDIANGEIVATMMSVIIPNGTINLDDMIGTIDTDGTVTLDGSTSTINLMGTTYFNTTIKIEEDTRVVVATTADTAIEVSNNVTVEDGRSDTTEGGASVTNGTITVDIPNDTTGVVITNTDDTSSSISTTGDTSETLVDGNYTVTVTSETLSSYLSDTTGQYDGKIAVLTEGTYSYTSGFTVKGDKSIDLNGNTINFSSNGYFHLDTAETNLSVSNSQSTGGLTTTSRVADVRGENSSITMTNVIVTNTGSVGGSTNTVGSYTSNVDMTFIGCTFNDAVIYSDNQSDKYTNVNITIDGCDFILNNNSNGIYQVRIKVGGDVIIQNTTFDITTEANNITAIYVASNYMADDCNVYLDNNTFNMVSNYVNSQNSGYLFPVQGNNSYGFITIIINDCDFTLDTNRVTDTRQSYVVYDQNTGGATYTTFTGENTYTLIESDVTVSDPVWANLAS